MSATARRKTTIVFAGDVGGTQEYDAAYNTDSPASTYLAVLEAGDNVVEVPTGATCVTIVKPSDNAAVLKLKGFSRVGDSEVITVDAVGITLHATDPDSITLGGTTEFVINSDADATVRLVWS